MSDMFLCSLFKDFFCDSHHTASKKGVISELSFRKDVERRGRGLF
jgi:hypothetical protein